MPIYIDVALATNSANEGATATGWFPLDQYSQPFNVGFAVSHVTTSSQWKVQHTFANVYRNPATPEALAPTIPASEIYDHSSVSAAQSPVDGNYIAPVRAVRFALASARTSGRSCARFQLIQAGY